jgi:6-phospho-beta-glucosidase
MKVTVIGGAGVRTPIVLYGLGQAHAALQTSEVVLYDIDAARLDVIGRLCREIVRKFDSPFHLRTSGDLKESASGATFVLNSVRVGGMRARARDERIAIENGLAGQETTGPGGAAMALRTLPVTLNQARTVESVAPDAWFINFTNPAGLITQALTQQTGLKVVGICDTPSELFHSLATCLKADQQQMQFDYAGLNHLGWIRSVKLQGRDITANILDDRDLLRHLYAADLFDPELIQTLRLIPTEYLFFYYSQRKAYQNQLRVGATRGEELSRLNTTLFAELAKQSDAEGLSTYRAYLSRRNASYMKLETQAGSALQETESSQDPFETATGYHRIALDVMQGLCSDQPRNIVLNVRNGNSMPDLQPSDVVEIPCEVDRNGARPTHVGALPESVRGLVLSVKAYERTLIQASLQRSLRLTQLALLEYPIIGQWEVGGDVLRALCVQDPDFLGYLK